MPPTISSYRPRSFGSAVAALAAGLLLLILFAWALLHLAPLVLGIIAAVFGIRWLKRSMNNSRPDPAITVVRERYARGEITKEEFDARHAPSIGWWMSYVIRARSSK